MQEFGLWLCTWSGHAHAIIHKNCRFNAPLHSNDTIIPQLSDVEIISLSGYFDQFIVDLNNELIILTNQLSF